MDYRKQYDWYYLKVTKINAIGKLSSVRRWVTTMLFCMCSFLAGPLKGKFGIINKVDNVSWSAIITDVKADNLSTCPSIEWIDSVDSHSYSVYHSFPETVPQFTQKLITSHLRESTSIIHLLITILFCHTITKAPTVGIEKYQFKIFPAKNYLRKVKELILF